MALRGVPGVRRLADAATAATSAQMLDAGDARLAALAGRLPARAATAARAGLPLPPAGSDELLARVARHRGVDFTALAQASRRLSAVADGIRRRHRALAEEAGLLWESWAGDDADGVADGVGDVARATQGVVVALEEAAARLEAAAVTVADAVAGLAAALDQLPPPEPDDRAGRTDGAADTLDPAVLRARAAAVDAPLHRLLVVLDRTDETVDRAWADLAAGGVTGAGSGTSGTPTAPGDDADDDAGLGAGLAGLLGPVAVTPEPGSAAEGLRPRR